MATLLFLFDFFLCRTPFSIPSFLNVTSFHYSVCADAVYSETVKWLLAG
jgi:hypothetical protein